MICFVSVSTFRKRIVELLKVKRGVYGGVTNEICQAFKDATIEQIRQNRDMILLNNDAAVIKLRMPDKKQHLSKADGYRLIYMVMKQSPLVALLDVYPKRGLSQQLDIEDNVYAVENCGLENQKVYSSLDEFDEKMGYFTIVVVK